MGNLVDGNWFLRVDVTWEWYFLISRQKLSRISKSCPLWISKQKEMDKLCLYQTDSEGDEPNA